jgi:hypothetical protein
LTIKLIAKNKYRNARMIGYNLIRDKTPARKTSQNENKKLKTKKLF